MDLDSLYYDANKLRDAADKLRKLNDILAYKQYEKYDVNSLFEILDNGVTMCCDHMEEIIEFRKENGCMYKYLDSNMSAFFKEVDNKAKKFTVK